MTEDEYEGRIALLELDLRRRDDQLRDARRERDLAHELLDEMRDQTESVNALLDSWIEAFDMQPTDDGKLEYASGQRELFAAHSRLQDEHAQLVRQWNKFVGDYNKTVAPRDRGRPLEASEAQVKAVRKLKKAGNSLRSIAAETGVGLRTVRTIIDKDNGTDRTAKRTNLLRRREMDRLRAARWRARKRGLDELPARISRTRKRGVELVKAAKGLGRE